MSRNIFRRPLIETFEHRCVLTSFGNWTPTIDASASAAEHAAHFVQYNSRAEAALEGGVESYDSRAAVDSKLAELVGTYWNGLLGRPVAEVQAVGSEQRYQIADGYGYKVTLSKFRTQTDGQVEAGSLAKTADGFIYRPADAGITIVDARERANLASKRIEAGSSYDSVLYVEGDRLIRLSRPFEELTNQVYGVDARVYRPTTRVEVFDITNRLNPVLTGELTLEGEHVASAVQNGRLTVVQFSDPNLVLPQPRVITRADGIQAFESTDQYLASHREEIYAAVMPSYQRSAAAQSPVADEIGDWQDFNVAADTLQNRTSIVTIDLLGQPRVVDSELILGLTEPIVYVGPDNVYLLKNSGNATDVYRVSLGLDGSVETSGHVRLTDTWVSPDWVGEYEGVLRVLAGPSPQWGPGLVDRSSTLVTIGDSGGQWRVQGQAEVSGSLVPTGVYFNGPQAVVLTGENYYEGRPATNYSVTLDLSNPASPRQLNSFQIPGFSTYLKQIDSQHWIGLRYGGPDSRGFLSGDRVVTLYSSSPSGLQVLDSWTDKTVYFNTNVPYTDMQIDYDPESGLVTVDGGYHRDLEIRASYQPILLRVALGASDPLQPVTIPGVPELVHRTFFQQGTLFVVTASSVVTYDTADLARRSDIVYLPGDHAVQLAGMGHRLSAGQTATVPVLGGYGNDFFTITSVELSGQLEASQQSKVTVLDNGMLQVQAASVEISTSEFLTIGIRYFDGQEDTLYQGLVIIGPKFQEEVLNGQHDISRTGYETDTPVKIWTGLQDEQGQPVSSLSRGDEAWVVIGAEDLSELRLGILGGYFQVDITSDNVEVIDQPEFLGDFKVNQVVTPSEAGFSVLGAQGTSWSSNGSARSDIVRFKIRVTDDQPINLRVTPTRVPDSNLFEQNILVYMGSEIHSTANADASVLSTDPSLNTVETKIDNARQDVNGDGRVTALDVLQIVNYINNSKPLGESVIGARAVDTLLSQLDVSGDGDVTALDVLLVINTLNEPQNSAASAEGESSTNAWSIEDEMTQLKKLHAVTRLSAAANRSK